jgi:hypothetical protein
MMTRCDFPLCDMVTPPFVLQPHLAGRLGISSRSLHGLGELHREQIQHEAVSGQLSGARLHCLAPEQARPPPMRT